MQDFEHAFDARVLTKEFVVTLDDVELEDARDDMAGLIQRYQQHFESVNGRAPQRTEMAPVALELRALVNVTNEKKRRTTKRVEDAGKRNARDAGRAPTSAMASLGADQAQGAALTNEIVQVRRAAARAWAGRHGGGIARAQPPRAPTPHRTRRRHRRARRRVTPRPWARRAPPRATACRTRARRLRWWTRRTSRAGASSARPPSA